MRSGIYDMRGGIIMMSCGKYIEQISSYIVVFV